MQLSANETDVLFEVDRENLSYKVTFFTKDKVEKWWWSGECRKIDPKVFKAAQEKVLYNLKDKQKI